jgi:hypothetical protein
MTAGRCNIDLRELVMLHFRHFAYRLTLSLGKGIVPCDRQL